MVISKIYQVLVLMPDVEAVRSLRLRTAFRDFVLNDYMKETLFTFHLSRLTPHASRFPEITNFTHYVFYALS